SRPLGRRGHRRRRRVGAREEDAARARPEHPGRVMRSFDAALVQMCATGDAEASVRSAVSLTQQALARGAELVVVPENFGGIGSPQARAGWAFDPAAPQACPAIAPFVDCSRDTDAVLVLGGHPERVDDTRTANVLLVLRRGRIVARYRK